jgi:hypothetical protein
MATNNMPWGDAFIVQTPTLDRWSQQLYQEQKIRQVKQQQEDAALDANIQKEIGKVRSVDTPEVIQAYHDYKQGRKQLLFDKQLQKDPLAYNQAQQKVLQNYQKVFTTANKSSELKDMQKQLTSDRMKNPNAYADDFGERMTTLMNTPVSGVGQHEVYGDLTNPDSYRYQGSNTDWAKIVNDSAGKTIKSAGTPTILPGGLQTSTPIYEFGNTPAQIKDNILGAMAVHQTGRDAAYTWDHIPEADIEKTVKDFQAIPKEDWQKMGLQGPQDIMPKNPDNKAENLASYFAMKHFIANRPRLVENKLQNNLKAIKDLDWSRDQVMEGIKFGHQKKLKEGEQKVVDNWITGYWDKRISDAKSGPPSAYQGPEFVGTKGAHKIELDGVAAKALARNGVEPSELYITQDNKLLPIFYEYQEDYDANGKKTGTSIKRDDNGNPVADKEYSRPISMDQAYLSMGYKGQTKKDLGGTMQGTYQVPKNETKKGATKVEDLRKKYNY